MDTTVPLPVIPYVDLTERAASQEGLSRQQLGYLGCVFFSITDAEVDRVLGFLQGHVSLQAYVDVSKVTSAETIISLLDAGAQTVFVAASQFEALKAYGNRVAIALQDESGPVHPVSGGTLILGTADLSASKSILKARAEAKTSPVFLFADSDEDLQQYVDLAREYQAAIIIPSNRLSVETPVPKNQLSVSAIIASFWTSDRPDHLVPTVVTDVRGIALGLVYSSQESLSESLKTGTGVYQSRKRGLWYKGATSGDTQQLVRVSLDCDQDCLRYMVKQQGRGMSIVQKLCVIQTDSIRVLPPPPEYVLRRIQRHIKT